MTKRKQTAKPQRPTAEKQYRVLIKEALDHFHEPGWVGENSPLAAPYLLGHWLPRVSIDQPQDALTCGNVLCDLIRSAVKTIGQGDKNRPLPWARILELRYLTEKPLKPSEIHLLLSTSKSAEGREHQKALDALVAELFALFRPSLRLETPAQAQRVVGRQAELDLCLAQLTVGRTIALHGPSGIGKTTFGAVLAHHFAPSAFFWFTFRPGLNDHENSVIFALAYFLHQQEITGTWLQLMADQGRIQEHTRSLLRHDLAELANRRVLLCFDEVDLLRPAEVQAHTRLVPLLDSLRQMAPLLLIGQKLALDADHVVVLSGLDFAALQQMLSKADIALQHEALLKLHQQTQGNPRLIELYLARLQAMRRQGLALEDLALEPSIELLLQRIWRHLNVEEMHLLELIALFQTPMPQAAWSTENEQRALATLLEWRLLQADGQGSVTMLPILQETILRRLDGDEAASLHLEAAQICLYYQQFTAAGHHYQAAGMASLTVYLLQEHLNTELDQGQAVAAERVLRSIAAHQLLSEQEREILRFLKAKLHQTLGEQELALEDIQKSLWKIPFLKVQAHRLKGDILELQGESTKALQAYRVATATIADWMSESASLHRATGYLHAHSREFSQAQQEVWRIRHDGANLEGYVLSKQRDFDGAKAAYMEALAFARRAQYAYGQANAGMNLGAICGWRREIDQAEQYLQEAIDFFAMTGRTNKLAEATYNLAFARRLAEHFAAAVEPAEEALQLFTKIGRALGRAYAMQILAEVYTALDDLAQAESFAQRVLQEENDNAYPDGLRALGEIRLKQGNLPEAEQLICDSLKIAKQNDDPVLVGYAQRSLGQVLMAKQAEQLAMTSFTAAMQSFRAANLNVEVESTQRIVDGWLS
ncbi:MAG: hypothetical protein R3C14_07650 [Caldilineaceae bacterium]